MNSSGDIARCVAPSRQGAMSLGAHLVRKRRLSIRCAMAV
jgi:hypothetical protein